MPKRRSPLSSLLLLLASVGLTACGGAEQKPQPTPAPAASAAPSKAPATDDDLAGRYVAAKERFGALLPTDKDGPKRILTELGPGLREVADAARDAHLRANASLLLGTLHESSGDVRSAISFYRQAAALLPGDAGPSRVLAIALAADNQFKEAIAEQRKVVEDDADDLESWLLLGELAVKAGEQDTATQAYAAYEMRRKGLIDGLTLKSADGTFPIPADQRAGCARALIPARDNGTAIALLYSLEIETDASVRQAVVEAMGSQRLQGYKPALENLLKKESTQEMKEAVAWALAEIQRDPLDTRPGPAPLTAPDAKTDAKAGDAKAADAKTPADAKADAKTPAAAKPDARSPAAAKTDAKSPAE